MDGFNWMSNPSELQVCLKDLDEIAREHLKAIQVEK